MLKVYLNVDVYIHALYSMVIIFCFGTTLLIYYNEVKCCHRDVVRPKMNHEISKTMFSLMLFFLVNAILEIPYAFIIFSNVAPFKQMLSPEQWISVKGTLYFMFMSRGVLLPILRWTEPLFWSQLVHNYKRLTSNKTNKSFAENSQAFDDPNIVFLSSSLNNMLVCGILKGISLSHIEFKPNELCLIDEVFETKFDQIDII